MIRRVVDRPSCRRPPPSPGLKLCGFAIPESVGKFAPRGAVDSRTRDEVFHETMNAPGEESKERRNSPERVLVSLPGAPGLSLDSPSILSN